jgi:hypothetical protein
MRKEVAMDDFNDSKGYQSSSSQGRITNIATKVLMPLGLFLITLISFLTSATEVPAWAYWIMAIYLVVSFLIILTLLAKNIIPKTINWFSRRSFAKKKRPELQELSNELYELLDSQRLKTIPYFLNQLSSKLSNEINILSCLEKNRQQFEILQSWNSSLVENLKHNSQTAFLRDAIQFSLAVNSFSWACERVRQVLFNTGIHEKVHKDVISEWNVSVQRILDFTSRVQRIMKSINQKYSTSQCRDYFQDVKPL